MDATANSVNWGGLLSDAAAGAGRLVGAYGDAMIRAKYGNVAQPDAVAPSGDAYTEGKPAGKTSPALLVGIGLAAVAALALLLKKKG